MKTVKEIYDEINKKYKCNEIYVEGFTTEQIYYQIEELCDKVFNENEKKVNKNYEKFLLSKRDDGKVNEDGSDEESIKDEESFEDEIIKDEESYDSTDSFEEKRKLLDEDISEETSSTDEDTLSDEGSIEDPEDLKDIPASELFKKLDKNIK
jgi:uncharacterized membrane-anchored protein YjiN (DUF445 family)